MKHFHFNIFKSLRVYPFQENMVSEQGNFFRILAIFGNREKAVNFVPFIHLYNGKSTVTNVGAPSHTFKKKHFGPTTFSVISEILSYPVHVFVQNEAEPGHYFL